MISSSWTSSRPSQLKIMLSKSLGSKSAVIEIFRETKFLAKLSDIVDLPVPGLPDIKIRLFLSHNKAEMITSLAFSSPTINVSK